MHCLASEWFKSYLPNRKQNVSINGYDSNLTDVICIHINVLSQGLNPCKVHHFADDKNLLHFTKSVSRLNKYVNLDLKNVTYLLNADKIALSVKKLN